MLLCAHPTRLRHPLACLCLLLLLGCGGGSAVTPGPIPTEKAVTPSFEEDRAVSTIVPPGGATIVATGADGDQFTVTIPAGARTEALALTVVPIREITGTPFTNGIAAGVDIRPHDVLFATPIQVTIQPASPPVGTALVFELRETDAASGQRSNQAASKTLISPGVFSVQCDGQQPFIWTVGVSATGSYGVGQTTRPSALAFIDGSQTPTPLAQQIRQRTAAEYTSVAALDRFLASGCDVDTQLANAKQALGDTFAQLLSPAMVAAQTNESLFFEALEGFLAWRASISLFGLDGDPDLDALIDDGQNLADTAAVFAAEKFLDQCDDTDFDGLVLSVLARRALGALLVLPQLAVLNESARFNTEHLLDQLKECNACGMQMIQSVTNPDKPLAGSFGTFRANLTGSGPETNRVIWDFGSDVAPEDRFREGIQASLFLPDNPGTHGGQVYIETICDTSAPDVTEFSYTVISCADDPELSQDLHVLSVTVVDLSDTLVQFIAEIDGPASEFTWDFGTGATPRIDHRPSPIVTKGQARLEPYVGTLGVGNICTSAELFFFDYRIEDCRGGAVAPEVLSVSPAGGKPGELATFQASIQGSATSLHWEFGTGASPSSSEEVMPVVTFGAPGTYSGSLAITNDCGEGTTFPFSYTVATLACPPLYMTHMYTGTNVEIIDQSGGSGSPSHQESPNAATFQFVITGDCEIELVGPFGKGFPLPVVTRISSFTDTSFEFEPFTGHTFFSGCETEDYLFTGSGTVSGTEPNLMLTFSRRELQSRFEEGSCLAISVTIDNNFTGTQVP